MESASTQEKITGPVVIDIQKDLNSLSRPNPYICKVPYYLRQLNEEMYESLIIAIGPYHYGKEKDHLKPMEDQKLLTLEKLLEEKLETDVSRYVSKVRELEERARNCYAEPVSLESDDFVKMLLLHGCFLVQLIRLMSPDNYNVRCFLTDLPTYIFNNFSNNVLFRDLLLLENQLPLFVLWELFCMIDGAVFQHIIVNGVLWFCQAALPGKARPKDDFKSINLSEIKHLLDFAYHYGFHPSTLELERMKGKSKNSSKAKEEKGISDYNLMGCAKELREAGINFEKVEGNTVFDISFENSTLYIREISIGDYAEPILRNLMVFERHLQPCTALKHVTCYIVFMDYLTESPKDVEIPCQTGIITNRLGDDTAVATMFNTLRAFIPFSRDHFYYSQVFKDVNEHCSRTWNKWMANLKHNYFNSPWALISFLAATLLLILPILQTVFSVLP